MSTLPAPPATPPAPRHRPHGGRLILGLLVLAVGVGWLLQVLDLATLRWDVILPAVLIALGLALVVAAPRGGSQGGPIALGIVLTLILLAGTVVDVPFRGGVGDRTYRPSTVADHTYELAVGKLTIDLSRSGVPVAVPDHVVIRAHVGVGQLVVVVPARFGSVDVRARAGIGQTDLFGQTQDGFGVEDRSPVTNDAGPLLRMDLSVGIGRVEVRSG